MNPAPPGRAARLHGRRDVRLGPAAPPVPGAGEVLVAVSAVGLCGSDLHWYDEGAIGDTRLSHPLVLGHELAGVIADGPRAGERVAVDPAEPCERCPLCLDGRGRLCPDVRFLGLDPWDGGLQTWIAVPERRCVTLPASIGDAEAVLLEVLGIALHAVDLAGLPDAAGRPGLGPAGDAEVGVYGSGPIGQLVIRALRARGVRRIVATDRLAHRVAAALSSGASEAFMVPAGGDGPDPAEAVPVDVAFECSGEDAALATAMRAVRPGGTVLQVGIPAGETAAFPASPFRRKELRLQAVRRMEGPDLARALEAVTSGAVPLDGLVTSRYRMEDVGRAFERALARDGLKVVVEPGR